MRPDQIAVDRLLAGEAKFTAAHDADRRAAVAALKAQGLTPAQISHRLGASTDVVRLMLRRASR